MLRDRFKNWQYFTTVLAIISHPFKSTPQRAIICSGWHVHPRRWSSLNSPPRFWLICRAHSTKYYYTRTFAGFNTADCGEQRRNYQNTGSKYTVKISFLSTYIIYKTPQRFVIKNILSPIVKSHLPQTYCLYPSPDLATNTTSILVRSLHKNRIS